jgi:hypothetical protein
LTTGISAGSRRRKMGARGHSMRRPVP